MFDRASLKLGLDKAVLQSMNSKDGSSNAGGQNVSGHVVFQYQEIGLGFVCPLVLRFHCGVPLSCQLGLL